MTTPASRSSDAAAEPFDWTADAGYPPPRLNPAGGLTRELAGVGELPWDGHACGWLVKTTATHQIHVRPMGANFRVQTSIAAFPVRHWCYAGRGPSAFVAAVLAAHAWDGADTTEPVGWNKNGQTGEWREPTH